MRARFEDIQTRKGNDSFVAYAFNLPAFEFNWHYHPEYELTLITRGSGKRLVGDSYQSYEAGDLVLLGPDLPHTWVSSTSRKKAVSATVIQFSDLFIRRFSDLPEFKSIALLLSSASRGLSFNSKDLATQVAVLPGRSGTEKILDLIQLLQKLSEQKRRKLASEYFHAVRGKENERRINTICQYLQKHSREEIRLESVAALVHLTPSAFCKFFKRATGKTLSDYLNDIRIGNACELLIESDKQISEIAYEAGFESLTYFNRVFMKKKSITPRRFREQVGVGK